MTRPVVFSLTASADTDAAANWLDEQRPGLGRLFLDQLGRSLRLIAQYPECGQRVRGPLRRVLVHRFSYAVIYQHCQETIEIVAVFDTRREPTASLATNFRTSAT